MNLDLFAVTLQRDRQSAHPAAPDTPAASPALSHRPGANTRSDRDNQHRVK